MQMCSHYVVDPVAARGLIYGPGVGLHRAISVAVRWSDRYRPRAALSNIPAPTGRRGVMLGATRMRGYRHSERPNRSRGWTMRRFASCAELAQRPSACCASLNARHAGRPAGGGIGGTRSACSRIGL